MSNWREFLRKIARENRVKIEQLLVLNPKYDPFWCGTEADHRKARWAKEVFDWVMSRWDELRERYRRLGYNFGRRPHERGIHYILVNKGDARHYDGRPYVGTEKDWRDLLMCFLKARYLGYIPWGAIEDRKHPEVREYLIREPDKDLGDVRTIAEREITVDDLTVALPEWSVRWELEIDEEVKKSITARIPVHIEIWTEKESEIVNQVGSKWFVNVQSAVGEQTPENVVSMLRRAMERSRGKPIRIFYVSDYDPRGEFTMHIAVARKIEFLVRNVEEFKGLDIKLKKICLTREQVVELNIPPAPVKETEPMVKRWKELRGEYIAEVNALETLYPEKFIEILEREIKRYIDEDAIRQIEEYNARLRQKIEEYNKKVRERVEEVFGRIKGEIEEKVREVFKDLREEVKFDFSEEFEEVKETIESWREPEWRVDDGDDDEWLYDSKRDYFEQLKYYKRVRG